MPAPASFLLRAVLALGAVGIVWGTTIPLTKIAVSTGHPALGLIAWQLLFAIVLLAPVVWWRGYRVPLHRDFLVYCLVIALIGTLVPNTFSYIAAANLPAGIIAVVLATVPMAALLIALTLGLEQFAVARLGGIALGVTAMILLAVPDASLPEPEKAIYLLVAVVAPLCYGLEGNYIALRAPRNVHPIAILFAASVIGAVIAVPAAAITGNWADLAGPWRAPEWALFGAAVAHLFAYAGYMALVGFAGVVFSAQVAYVVTVSAIAFSIAFLGESYSAWVWAAIAMMLGGLMLVQPVGRLPETEGA